jgi:hypothetical protein
LTFAWNLTPALDAFLYDLIPALAPASVTTVTVSWMTGPPAGTEAAMEAGRKANTPC